MLPIDASDRLTLEKIYEIADYCGNNLTRHPTVYYSLQRFFFALSDEFEQAVTSDRYEELSTLVPLLVGVRDAPDNLRIVDDFFLQALRTPRRA